jgi:predicted SprT family Zn-dependent metalloprotease
VSARRRSSAKGTAARGPGRAPAERVAFLQLLLPLFAPRRGGAQVTAPPSLRTAPASAPTGIANARAEEVLDRLWRDNALGWSGTWGVADLRATVRVELSHRMRSSLGGFYPQERLIRIADTLLEAPPHLLQEVLCHEAAHAAVHILHGGRARSHGREWRELMRAVGLEPRVRIPREEIGPAAQRAARKRWVWRHRCPACRAQRLAGRPVRQWRCGLCREAGGDGRLVITRVAARAAQARS